MSSSRKVKDWLKGYLEYTSNTEPRRSFRLWTAISTIAAVLQRKCYLEWGMETFYPNMYIILVGPPASRKGTAIRPGKDFLDRIGLPLAADESSRQKLISSLANNTVTDPNEDGEIICHSSMTIIATELTVFLGYQNTELLTYMCKWYDCETRFTYDTYTRGIEEVPNVWVNLLGGTTPTLLQTSLPANAIGSGFTSRTVFVYEDYKEKVVWLPALTNQQIQLREDLLQDLERIRSLSGRYTVTQEFLDEYKSWRESEKADSMLNEPRLEFYCQRRPVHLLKLSMIISAGRRDDLVITGQDLLDALEILESTEERMPMVFRGVGDNPLASAQLRVMRILAARKEVKLSTLAELLFNDISQKQLSEIIAILETMNFSRLVPKERKLVYIEREKDK